MTNHTEPTLSAEQLAAYLDGMASIEESACIEQAIEDDPALQEIQDSIDSVDASLIAYDESLELPIELLADDFQLPVIDYSFADATDSMDINGDEDIADDGSWDMADYDDYEGVQDDEVVDDTYDNNYNDIML